jgi:hemoglobin
MQELEVYSMIGTEDFTRLVAAFYRQVPQDDLLGPMYPTTDLLGAEQRLRDFLIGRFGGPQTYIEQKRPSTPPRAAFFVPYKSDCSRPMDALDE